MPKKLHSNSFRLNIAPESATSYWLLPSATQVKRRADGVHVPEFLSCESMAKTGGGAPVSGIGSVKFIFTYKTGGTSAEFIYASRIIVTPDLSSITFRLYVDGKKMDEKTVSVIDDGANGLPGSTGARGQMPYPCGKWGATTRYTATDSLAPFVYYEAGKTTYVMNKITSVVGLDPAKDYADNGTNATWIPFEKYMAIYTEIIMADFGKLASTVFFGDYLFSQEGVDDRGLPTNKYEDFNTPAFNPNYQLNSRTGELKCKKLEAEGSITGSIRNKYVSIDAARMGSSIVIDIEKGLDYLFYATGANIDRKIVLPHHKMYIGMTLRISLKTFWGSLSLQIDTGSQFDWRGLSGKFLRIGAGSYVELLGVASLSPATGEDPTGIGGMCDWRIVNSYDFEHLRDGEGVEYIRAI